MVGPAAVGSKLDRAGVARIVTVFASLVVTAGLYFAGAGTLALFRGWLYYGGQLLYLAAALALILVVFPGAAEVVNARGHLTRADVKGWDKRFGLAYSALLVVAPVVTGLDAGRFHAAPVAAWLAWPALAVTLSATAFVHWAMVVNRFAETGVRIQKDRGHEVITTGPYRFVRHPFYAASIAIQLAFPLALGSLWGYAPALAIVALFVWRTAREDATLRAELAGYEAYARRVRFRLLPGVW